MSRVPWATHEEGLWAGIPLMQNTEQHMPLTTEKNPMSPLVNPLKARIQSGSPASVSSVLDDSCFSIQPEVFDRL